MLPADASDDQENCPPDYYRRNNGMLVEKPKQDSTGGDSNPISAATLSILHSMPKEALISLIQRVSGAMWGIGLKTQDDIAEAFKLKLAIGGMSEKDMFKALPVMREWFDRSLGKAPQSIAMTVKDDGLGKLSTDKLLRLAAMLDEPLIIPPMHDKLQE